LEKKGPELEERGASMSAGKPCGGRSLGEKTKKKEGKAQREKGGKEI